MFSSLVCFMEELLLPGSWASLVIELEFPVFDGFDEIFICNFYFFL